MGMFSLDEQSEYLELECQVQELKEQLRIAREGRQFFYKDAQVEHNRTVALQHENDMLKQELQELGLRYDALAGRPTNSEDSYREGLYSTDDYLTILDAVWDRR